MKQNAATVVCEHGSRLLGRAPLHIFEGGAYIYLGAALHLNVCLQVFYKFRKQ